MGQYYRIYNASEAEQTSKTSLGKLLEFGMVNTFDAVQAMALLADTDITEKAKIHFDNVGSWCNSNFAVVGDYAKSDRAIAFMADVKARLNADGIDVVLEEGEEPSLYNHIKEVKTASVNATREEPMCALTGDTSVQVYLVNSSKSEFVDLNRHNSRCRYLSWDNTTVCSPLMILCSDGNGLGGGDYYTTHAALYLHVGAWAYDNIKVQCSRPEGTEIFPTYIPDEHLKDEHIERVKNARTVTDLEPCAPLKMAALENSPFNF